MAHRRALPFLSLLLVAAPAPLHAEEDPVIALARAKESAQLKALDGVGVELETTGRSAKDDEEHSFTVRRRLVYSAGGAIVSGYLSGTYDGLPVTEEQMREKRGGSRDKRADANPATLTPFSVPGVRIENLGKKESGRVLLRWTRPSADHIESVTVEVDPSTGAKRSLTVKPGGAKVRFLDFVQVKMSFGDDGALEQMESRMTGSFLGTRFRSSAQSQRVRAPR